MKKNKKYAGHLLLGVGILLTVVWLMAGIVEIFQICEKIFPQGGVIIAAALMLLIVWVVGKTARNILRAEREKQQAILGNEAKAKFLANMSHEIRTPLNTIIGMNEMILRENQDEAILEYAQNIQSASRMLLSLINDVLDFSKIQSGKLELEETQYQLASLLNDVIHQLEAKVSQKNLDLIINIEENLPSILKGDEIRVKQVLRNLLTNAVKYTQEGSITFSVEGIWENEEQFYLRTSIADTGIGIREEDLERMFHSFTRLDEKRNRRIEGTGLGLSITKQLIERMNGEIQVQSVYGKGSLFTVKIPQKVIEKEAIGNLKQAYEREVQTRGKYEGKFRAPGVKILAVDDNDMNLEVVRGLLKTTGIYLDTATGGDECLSKTREKKYDLILMDHMMPEPDGIETLHLLRGENKNPNVKTKVIALTANAVAGSREIYLKEGFSDYLSKPIEAEKFEKMLQKNLPEDKVTVEKEEEKFTEAQVITEEVSAEERKSEVSAAGSLIDKEAGMAYCAGDKDMYLDILKAYYDQGEKYSQDMKDYLEKKDWKNYSITVHAIKSTSMTIGASALSEKAKKLEMAAKEAQEEIIHNAWEELYQDYQNVLGEIKEIFDRQMPKEAGETEIVSKEEYRKQCENLLEKIKAYEMNEAMEQIKKLQKMSTSPEISEKQRKMLDRIGKAVDDFDYELAEADLQEWIGEQ